MKNIFMNAKELNVKVGDTVSVQGNRGSVSEVIRTEDSTLVRVHFSGYLAEFGQYQDQIYGGFVVIE